MKRHFILGIMALAALVSCSKSEVLNQESLNEKGITFSAYLGKSTQTKASEINKKNAAAAGIGVIAWRTGEAEATDHVPNYAPTFMKNVLLTVGEEAESGLYSATYTPQRYWPSTGAKVSFYAYAPYSTGIENLLPTGTTSENNLYHPENITFDVDQVGAEKLTLKVPAGEADNKVITDETNTVQSITNGEAYASQTDFMVARVGNGVDNSGSVTNADATSTFVGVNQNLNKEHTGAVTLTMKHALSRISFEAKAEDANGPQDMPYANAKVVFDHIIVNGSFVNQATYELLNEKWNNFGTAVNSYGFINKLAEDLDEGTSAVDAFNPIADELYNLSPAEGAEEDETNTPNEDGWYKLNKSTHDLMVIPYTADATASKITNISGCYQIRSYYDDGSLIRDENYTDKIYFSQEVNLDLEAGKSYIFRFNIKLKAITFEVAVEDWNDDAHSVIPAPTTVTPAP